MRIGEASHEAPENVVGRISDAGIKAVEQAIEDEGVEIHNVVLMVHVGALGDEPNGMIAARYPEDVPDDPLRVLETMIHHCTALAKSVGLEMTLSVEPMPGGR